ncbi:MAG: hypothetical protein JWN76_3621 [Chitinophagaceae bacterium]|nr:hypothetical protein [Chitinophagaceae bacterium]
MGDEELVAPLTASHSPFKYKLKITLVLIAIVFGILSIANLRKPATSSDREVKKGIDIMVALDVSKSMLSEDVKPNRLDKAKQCVKLLLNELADNRLGLVLFAGQAYLQMPLTADAAAAAMYLANATPDAVPVQGTVVADALHLASTSFNNKEKKYKAIILITDGEDHDPNITDTLQSLYDQGIIVYTIGVGTPEGSPIIEPGTNELKKDNNGQTVISKLNEDELKLIAQKTGGSYARLDDAAIVTQNILKHVNQMEGRTFGNAGSQKVYASFYPYFLALALLLLVIETFIPETKRFKR